MAIVEVVKYNASPDILAWKYPNEELGTWTQLIVNESQEALLLKGGKIFDVFQSGRHTLETANIPLLSAFMKLPFGGKSPFTAEVWFINKIHVLDIKWGTTTPIQLQDPKYNVFIPLRAFGQFGVRIQDAKQFLTKLVGPVQVFSTENVQNYFRGLYVTTIKDAISIYLVKSRISLFEINAYITEISAHLQKQMQPIMAEYGIELLNFYVNDISAPEDDEAVKQLKSALAKKAEMDIIGYSYQQERSFDTLEGAATNPGTGSDFMGAAMGIGMGTQMAAAMGASMANIASAMQTTPTPMPCVPSAAQNWGHRCATAANAALTMRPLCKRLPGNLRRPW